MTIWIWVGSPIKSHKSVRKSSRCPIGNAANTNAGQWWQRPPRASLVHCGAGGWKLSRRYVVSFITPKQQPLQRHENGAGIEDSNMYSAHRQITSHAEEREAISVFSADLFSMYVGLVLLEDSNMLWLVSLVHPDWTQSCLTSELACHQAWRRTILWTWPSLHGTREPMPQLLTGRQ